MNRLAFSDDMMRALAAGEKTMTRRPEKRAVPANEWVIDDGPGGWSIKQHPVLKSGAYLIGSRLQVGSLVAATCAFFKSTEFDADGDTYTTTVYRYRMTGEGNAMQYKAARIMPAALAPFVLRITEVRAERLGEITDEDAVREGMMHWARATATPTDLEIVRPRSFFAAYWRKLYSPGAWERDRESWVWCYSFTEEERRIG